jgi:hypothetical protein
MWRRRDYMWLLLLPPNDAASEYFYTNQKREIIVGYLNGLPKNSCKCFVSVIIFTIATII